MENAALKSLARTNYMYDDVYLGLTRLDLLLLKKWAWKSRQPNLF